MIIHKHSRYIFGKPLMLIIFLCIGTLGYGQGIGVSGTVRAENEGPLPGVNITVKGTKTGTQTDFDGKYSLSNISPDATLVFSYIGFVNQEVKVNSRSTIDVSLRSDQESLDEIVVVGFGTVKKSDLTGSVSSVKAKDFNQGANASISQALEGRIAGVQIEQKSNEPGGGFSVNIRGSGSINAGTEPLYVIDGVIVNNGAIAGSGGAGFTANHNPRNPLNSLNPADIASIEVLKDASSTAIYGSRGSNGVVLITTKQGQEGKLKFNFDYSYGIQEAAKTLDLLSPHQYRDVLNAIIDDGGGDPTQRIEDIEGEGTDWMKEVLRTAPTQDYNFSLSGGTPKINYYSSLNYFSQEGLVEGSGTERYNIRLSLNSNSEDQYRYGINMNASYINNDFASTGTGINENGGALYSAINFDPTISPYNEDGTYKESEFITIDNPLSILHGKKAEDETFRFFGNTFFEYYVLPGLSAKFQLGADLQQVRRDVFIQPYTLTGRGTGGIASILTGRKDYVSMEGTLNYNKQLGDDNLTALLGATYEYYQTKSFSGDARGFALPDLGTNAIGSGDPELNHLGSGRAQSRFISYLARINYSLNNKYLFTASIRSDGSSRFGKNNKFGYFPSGAVAWKMNEEDFLKDVSWLSQLKIRGSVGVTGNANIGNSLTFQTFSSGDDILFGTSYYNTIYPTRLSNPGLTWESAVQYDLGVDFSLFKNRLSGTIDYFDKETKDLLLAVPQALNTGYNVQTQNLGGVRNRGVELELNVKPIQSENLSWELSGNVTFLKNKVLNIGDRGDILRGQQSQIPDFSLVRPGEVLDAYYGFIVDGVWQEDDDFSVTESQVRPGDLKYRDINGDGKINSDDRTVIGKAIPDITWGLINHLEYKGFSLDVSVKGVKGVERLNGNLLNTYSPNNFRRNRIAKPLLNRWTPENPTNKYPSFVNPTSQGGDNALINSRTVEDASYIRLQSVKLGYEVPVEHFAFLDRLSVYIVGQNLLTITNYSGVDPAANASGSNTSALDFNAYPVPRIYSIGLSVEF